MTRRQPELEPPLAESFGTGGSPVLPSYPPQEADFSPDGAPIPSPDPIEEDIGTDPSLIPPPDPDHLVPAPCDQDLLGKMPPDDCPPSRFWISAEYLFWWMKDSPLPVPLVTTGPAASLGVLGSTGTSVLLGNSDVNYDFISGGRVSMGLMFNNARTLGVEGSAFLLENDSEDFEVSSNAAGTPLLARPFLNAVTGVETAAVVALPGLRTGGVDVSSSSQLWGSEVNLVGGIIRRSRWDTDLLLGFRYLDLDEDLRIRHTTTILPGGSASFSGAVVGAGNVLTVSDRFATRNQFYGGQIGARTQVRWRRAWVQLLGKVAAGANHEVLVISGNSSRSGPVPTVTVPGGLLALPTNIGRTARDEFALVPEAGVNVGYQIFRNVNAYAGYTFLYWDDVLRPGDQIDRSVNPTRLPTSSAFGTPTSPLQPAVSFRETDFWTHGANFGLALRF